jgi:alkylated DNA nucleotide flippase Atl1
VVRAENGTLSGVLEGKKQYQIPLYQRVYSWGKRQLEQLWSDVVELGRVLNDEPQSSHFIGSLVLASSPDFGAIGVNKFLVVDGQQRLTTLTLLLAALRDHLIETGDIERANGIDAQYLINVFDRGKPHKVLPTQADRPSYMAVLNRSPQAGGEDAVGDAYRFFRSKIAAADDPDDPHDLEMLEAAVVRGLALVVVTAEASDNAHRIFESLNNTGLRLTQSDLLKNYLFMRLGDSAESVYSAVWVPLETKLDSENLELLFWLDLVQRDERAKQSDTYAGQQKRFERLKTVAEVEAEVRRIAKLGDVLATILQPEEEKHPEVRRRLARIRAWGSTTAYPVVMQILARRAEGRASDEEAVRALLYLESYFVRRVVIGRATANLNRTLLQAVTAISATSGRVDVVLREYLSRGRKYFATDAQVREAATSIAFYWQGRGPQKKLILQWLEEAFHPKEVIELDAQRLTIEHVLPQTLSESVRETFAQGFGPNADLDYEHERLVHTLGNLTLTGYNSELSNKPFDEKREMLARSGLYMNHAIAAHNSWGANEINARSSSLAEQIIDLWPGPDESVTSADDEPSALRSQIAGIIAEIPAGRWTSYGDVAIVASTWAQPLAAIISTNPMPNAWRVLQSGGTISPGFRWLEPDRTDDPRVILEEEGLRFDSKGHADPAQFMSAEELAAAAGLDVDEDVLVARRGKTKHQVQAGSKTLLKDAQLAFFERLRDYGRENAAGIKSWPRGAGQHWYDVRIGDPRGRISLTVNSQKKVVSAGFWIDDDQVLFAKLFAQRERIEAQLGFVLVWDDKPGRKSSGFGITRPGDFMDENQSQELVRWLVTKAESFGRVLPKLL